MKNSVVDLFGNPQYVSESARKSEWSRIISQMLALNLLRQGYLFADLNTCVLYGFVSPQSASWLLSGRAPAHAYVLFESFLEFLRNYESCFGYVVRFDLVRLWSRKNLVNVEVNTFPFPLEELASKKDTSFEVEKSVYNSVSLLDLQVI